MSRPAADTPDPIAYLDAAAAAAAGADYKRRLRDALGVTLGQTAVDLGCGPGTDLARLADAVGESGMVVGVDRKSRMLDEARRRLADRPNVRLWRGDVHALPLPDDSVDRARVDRVAQHLADPAAALCEVRRVLRPGGLLALAEPDWDTLAVADEDVSSSRRFAAFVAGRVRNPTIGRDLVRLCGQAGFGVRSVDPVAVLFRDFGTADQILGLRRNAARAVRAGAMDEAAAGRWLRRLACGPVVAGCTLYLVVAEA